MGDPKSGSSEKKESGKQMPQQGECGDGDESGTVGDNGELKQNGVDHSEEGEKSKENDLKAEEEKVRRENENTNLRKTRYRIPPVCV